MGNIVCHQIIGRQRRSGVAWSVREGKFSIEKWHVEGRRGLAGDDEPAVLGWMHR